MSSFKTSKLSFLLQLKVYFIKFWNYFTDWKNWKSSPKLWIVAYICIRLILAFLRKHGLTLWKKNLSKEHVFLTGAGNGLGR